jgi:hypothetical protein
VREGHAQEVQRHGGVRGMLKRGQARSKFQLSDPTVNNAGDTVGKRACGDDDGL